MGSGVRPWCFTKNNFTIREVIETTESGETPEETQEYVRHCDEEGFSFL